MPPRRSTSSTHGTDWLAEADRDREPVTVHRMAGGNHDLEALTAEMHWRRTGRVVGLWILCGAASRAVCDDILDQTPRWLPGREYVVALPYCTERRWTSSSWPSSNHDHFHLHHHASTAITSPSLNVERSSSLWRHFLGFWRVRRRSGDGWAETSLPPTLLWFRGSSKICSKYWQSEFIRCRFRGTCKKNGFASLHDLVWTFFHPKP